MVVGHDRGATIAADSALLRPEVSRAVGLLNVPYTPRGGPRPGDVFARMGGQEEFHVSSQEPDRAKAERPRPARGLLRGPVQRSRPALRQQRRNRLAQRTEPRRPRRGFERTGLTVALNRYRNMDRD
ncbi:hypothetical protein [Actinomadura kijaniata]|uniref:hypothetical protein n=1 Tax=Actinomadura kijaniata TaxID=46161 RepID=UPI003F534E8E